MNFSEATARNWAPSVLHGRTLRPYNKLPLTWESWILSSHLSTKNMGYIVCVDIWAFDNRFPGLNTIHWLGYHNSHPICPRCLMASNIRRGLRLDVSITTDFTGLACCCATNSRQCVCHTPPGEFVYNGMTLNPNLILPMNEDENIEAVKSETVKSEVAKLPEIIKPLGLWKPGMKPTRLDRSKRPKDW